MHDYSAETSICARTSTLRSGVSVRACPLCAVECLRVHDHSAEMRVRACTSTPRTRESVCACPLCGVERL